MNTAAAAAVATFKSIWSRGLLKIMSIYLSRVRLTAGVLNCIYFILYLYFICLLKISYLFICLYCYYYFFFLFFFFWIYIFIYHSTFEKKTINVTNNIQICASKTYKGYQFIHFEQEECHKCMAYSMRLFAMDHCDLSWSRYWESDNEIDWYIIIIN